MTNVRLPVAVCAAVAEALDDSHPTLNALFKAAGAPGSPPDLAHHSKWKTWLLRAGHDPNVDSLAVLGSVIEEFMDLPPLLSASVAGDNFGIDYDPVSAYKEKRSRLNTVLEEHGFRYFRGGRVIPNGETLSDTTIKSGSDNTPPPPLMPSSIENLLRTLLRGLPRAMHPLAHRRKNAQSLNFETEYDIQDLLHSQLRPWVSDIRPEEFTPSHAGSATRMDFLLPAHKLVIEVKRVRDKKHASKVGDELILDIEHYRKHPDCEQLWCAIYDPDLLISNPSGIISGLEGSRSTPDGSITVNVMVIGGDN